MLIPECLPSLDTVCVGLGKDIVYGVNMFTISQVNVFNRTGLVLLFFFNALLSHSSPKSLCLSLFLLFSLGSWQPWPMQLYFCTWNKPCTLNIIQLLTKITLCALVFLSDSMIFFSPLTKCAPLSDACVPQSVACCLFCSILPSPCLFLLFVSSLAEALKEVWPTLFSSSNTDQF